jgi:hypothetical protein
MPYEMCTMERNRNFVEQVANLMPHIFVGRTPASAADPLVGYSDFVEISTSRARAPGAGQGTRPTNSMRKREKYVAFGCQPAPHGHWSIY